MAPNNESHCVPQPHSNKLHSADA